MDEQERSFQMEQMSIKAAVAKSGSYKPKIVSTGFCHNCDDPVTQGRLYCDDDCAKDHQKRLSQLPAKYH